MWSSVGSVGVADSLDLPKIVIIGSVAQLGYGVNVIQGSEGAPIAERAEKRRGGIRPPPPMETATLRYPVDHADLGDQDPGVWNLTARYCDGAGVLSIQLIQVALATGTETVLIWLLSDDGYNPSSSFHNEIAQGTFGTSGANAYYVAVTLTAPVMNFNVRPAIQLLQIGPAGLV